MDDGRVFAIVVLAGLTGLSSGCALPVQRLTIGQHRFAVTGEQVLSGPLTSITAEGPVEGMIIVINVPGEVEPIRALVETVPPAREEQMFSAESPIYSNAWRGAGQFAERQVTHYRSVFQVTDRRWDNQKVFYARDPQSDMALSNDPFDDWLASCSTLTDGRLSCSSRARYDQLCVTFSVEEHQLERIPALRRAVVERLRELEHNR